MHTHTHTHTARKKSRTGVKDSAQKCGRGKSYAANGQRGKSLSVVGNGYDGYDQKVHIQE